MNNPNDKLVFRIRLFALIKAKQVDDPTLNNTSVEKNNQGTAKATMDTQIETSTSPHHTQP